MLLASRISAEAGLEISAEAEERRAVKETPAQKLIRLFREFLIALTRTGILAAIFLPLFLASLLSIDLPIQDLDHFFQAPETKPSNWLSWGGIFMALAPLLGILMARRFGGDEASRAVTAAWGVAAVAVVAELTYLAPVLEDGDFPSSRFAVAFVAAAMAGQFFAISVYDVTRGSGAWWRPPLYSALSGFGVQAIIYYPAVYWQSGAPWPNWMVADFALKCAMVFVFLPIYWQMRRTLRPRGGFGG